MVERAVAAPRRAESADLPALALMLARALVDDPVAVWAIRPNDLRPRVLERLFAECRLPRGPSLRPMWPEPRGESSVRVAHQLLSLRSA
jgi:hypothetical protein